MSTEVACRDALARLENDDLRCPKFDELHPECICESCSASPHSPGKVANDEVLLRAVYSPHHVDPETGEFKNAALADAENTGLSADRLQYTTRRQIERQIKAKLETPRALEKGYVYQGILPITCGLVRQLTYGNGTRRCYAVYDTALQDNNAHAEVFQVKLTSAQGKQARERLRKLLIKSEIGFGKPRELTEFFPAEKTQTRYLLVGLLRLILDWLRAVVRR